MHDVIEKPYLRLTKTADAIKTQGQDACFLGHQLSTQTDTKEGVFVKWKFEKGSLEVINDYFGLYPIYYYQKDNDFILSSSIYQLLQQGADASLDYASLAVFLRMGFYVGNDTPFQYIKTLPPNSRLLWQNGEISIDESKRKILKSNKTSYDDAIVIFDELFQKSIAKRKTENNDFAVLLSGGRDSRHILLELLRQGRTPKFCITTNLIPPRSNEDVGVAARVTNRLNIQHHIVEQNESFFNILEWRNKATNYCSDEHFEGMGMAESLRGKTNFLFDGIGGDVISTGLFVDEKRFAYLQSKDIDALTGSLLGQFRNFGLIEEIFDHVFVKEFSQEVAYEKAFIKVKNEMSRYLDQPNPLQQFFIWNRTRREIALSPYAILSDIQTAYTPFLDIDLVEFCMSFEPKVFMDGQFHNKVINFAFPEYLDMPYADNKKGQDPVSMRKKYMVHMLKYLLQNRMSAAESLNLKYILPRMAKYLIQPNNWWINPPMMQYVLELMKFSSAKG